MTENDINIAIATACGWELKPRLFHNGQWQDIPTWVKSEYYKGKPDDYCMAGQAIGQQPPNYCRDLNKVREAEQQLIVGNYSLFSGDTPVQSEYARRVGTFADALKRASEIVSVLRLSQNGHKETGCV